MLCVAAILVKLRRPIATSLKSMSSLITERRGDGEILKFAWYNSGFTAQMMEGQLGLTKMTTLTKDVLDALNHHNLHVLGLCELGEHLTGLNKVRGLYTRLSKGNDHGAPGYGRQT